jgi:hypothetical protein
MSSSRDQFICEFAPGELISAQNLQVAFNQIVCQLFLTLGCGKCHGRVDSYLLQSLCNFAQLGGSPASVFGDSANQIIRKPFLPTHRRIRGSEGFENFILRPVLTGCEETLDSQGF